MKNGPNPFWKGALHILIVFFFKCSTDQLCRDRSSSIDIVTGYSTCRRIGGPTTLGASFHCWTDSRGIAATHNVRTPSSSPQHPEELWGLGVDGSIKDLIELEISIRTEHSDVTPEGPDSVLSNDDPESLLVLGNRVSLVNTSDQTACAFENLPLSMRTEVWSVHNT